MSGSYLVDLHRWRIPHQAGQKARQLHRLGRMGFPIPQSYAVLWTLEAHVQRQGVFPQRFLRHLNKIILPGEHYAIRSSANAEDSRDFSFAGQFLSVLDVQGVDAVLDAISRIWESAHYERPRAYRDRKKAPTEDIAMGVVIQKMVPAKVSGVAFSRNPISGLNEVVIEAVKGSGMDLVQGGVTPSRWVWKWGRWMQKPVDFLLPPDVVDQLARQVRAIHQRCGYPVDLEWVFDGERIIWVQMRRITALDDVDIYANHIPKEFMPGLIKPLVWSVNIPLVNEAWIWLLTELLGDNELDPHRLARQFYGHAYFNMGLLGSVFKQLGIPANTLERLMGFEADGEDAPSFRPSLRVLRYLPRMLRFVVNKARFDRQLDQFLQRIEGDYAALMDVPLEELSLDGLLDRSERLFALNQQTAYFNIVTPLLMQLYHRMARGRIRARNLDYEQIRWLDNWDGRERFDPVPHLRRLAGVYQTLPEVDQQSLLEGGWPVSSETAAFIEQVGLFMGQFGHLSDSGNDFSHPLWEEDPDLVIRMIAGFSPAERERAGNIEPQPILFEGGHDFILDRAMRFSRYREQISFVYTRGYGGFRRTFHRMGELFFERGWLRDPEDVFYLTREEVTAAVQEGKVSAAAERAEERKEELARFARITPPPIIYGETAPPISGEMTLTLVGIPTSRGHHRGRVCVVRGIADFGRVEDGCVLVIPYSDVSWTPLFARAGAVIAESGGMLSHSSIVAREYGIPAIVSVPNACQLEDGSIVTVDGYAGVIVPEEEQFGKGVWQS